MPCRRRAFIAPLALLLGLALAALGGCTDDETAAGRPFREIRSEAPKRDTGDGLPRLWLPRSRRSSHSRRATSPRAQGAYGQGAAKRHAGGRAQSSCLCHRLDGAARGADGRHCKRPHQHRPARIGGSDPTRLRRRSDQHHELPPRARSPRASSSITPLTGRSPRTASRAGPIGRR